MANIKKIQVNGVWHEVYDEAAHRLINRVRNEMPADLTENAQGRIILIDENGNPIGEGVAVATKVDDLILKQDGGENKLFLAYQGKTIGQGVVLPATGSGESIPEYDGTVIITKPEVPVSIVGVTGLTNSTGALTLTDDAEGVSAYTTSTNGDYVSVASDMSNFFPFNEITEFTDNEGNVFIKYPKLYMKWETDDAGLITGYKFSKDKVDDTYFIPDAFLDPKDTTGSTYLDYFALGKYEMSGTADKGYSVSGATPLVNITRAQARAAARAYGTDSDYYGGYQQLDFAQWSLFNLMAMMFYQTMNIQTVWGGRTGAVQSWSSASVTGTCDGVDGLNGWNTSTDCAKILGIEGAYDNVAKWVDGFYSVAGTVYAHRYPQYYADSSENGVELGFMPSYTDGEGQVTGLKHGTSDLTKSYVYVDGVAFESEDQFNTYTGDYYYHDTTSEVVLYVGGIWDASFVCGLWFAFAGVSASLAFSYVGARLSYRPL